VYEDGDEEDLSLEDLTSLLVENSAVPADVQSKLDAWVYTYTYGPNIPPVAATILPTKYIDLTPRELTQVDIYQRYIGRSFIDKETGMEYRVKSVCRNDTYSELLFRYYRVDEGDVGNDDFSGCSEMLNGVNAGWALWIAEPEAKAVAEQVPTSGADGADDTREGPTEEGGRAIAVAAMEEEVAADSDEDGDSGYGSHGDEIGDSVAVPISSDL
jgi:hypothetical protein